MTRGLSSMLGEAWRPHDGEAQMLARALRAGRLTVLVGAAGVGKSTLLTAGVLPLLHRRAEDEHPQAGRGPQVVVPFPERRRRRQGEQLHFIDRWSGAPLDTLARALDDAPAVGQVRIDLAEAMSPERLVSLSQRHGAARLLFVFDHFEHLLAGALRDPDLHRIVGAWAVAVQAPGLDAHFLVAVDDRAWPGVQALCAGRPDIDLQAFRLWARDGRQVLDVLAGLDGEGPADNGTGDDVEAEFEDSIGVVLSQAAMTVRDSELRLGDFADSIDSIVSRVSNGSAPGRGHGDDGVPVPDADLLDVAPVVDSAGLGLRRAADAPSDDVASSAAAADAARVAAAYRAAEARRAVLARSAAEAARTADAERRAEAAKAAEALQEAEARRLAQALADAEAAAAREARAREAAEAATRAAEAEQRAQAGLLAQAERSAEAARQAEAAQQAEAQRLTQALAAAEAAAAREVLAREAVEAAVLQAQAERQAEAMKLAEAQRVAQAEADQRAAAQRDAEAARQADAERVAEQAAEAQRLAQALADAQAQAAREAQAREAAEAAARAAEAERVSERARLERLAEDSRLAQAQAEAERKAEAGRQAEVERRIEAERQAEAAARAEAERLAEAHTQAEAAALREQRAGQAAEARAREVAETLARDAAAAQASEAMRARDTEHAQAQEAADRLRLQAIPAQPPGEPPAGPDAAPPPTDPAGADASPTSPEPAAVRRRPSPTAWILGGAVLIVIAAAVWSWSKRQAAPDAPVVPQPVTAAPATPEAAAAASTALAPQAAARRFDLVAASADRGRARFDSELAAALATDATPLRVVPAADGAAPIQGLAAPGRLAIVRLHALRDARDAGAPPLRVLTPLYPEAVLFVVRADSPLRYLHELGGKRLAIGPVQGDGSHTVRELYRRLFGTPMTEPAQLDDDQAVAELVGFRSVDAMAVVVPQPAAWWATLDPGTARRLRVLAMDPKNPLDGKLLQSLGTSVVRTNVGAPKGKVLTTPTVMSYLVVSGEGDADVERLTAMAQALCRELPRLRKSGDATWRALQPGSQLDTGWPVVKAVQSTLAGCKQP